MSNSKRNLSRGVFVVVIILGVFLAVYLLYGKNNQNLKISTPTDQTKVGTNNTEEFFQKPGSENNNSVPVKSTAQNKSASELEQTISNQQGTAADYNLLATTYYKNGDKDKALQTINDGLAKYPNDNSILQTKDLIENILPNL